MPDKPIIFAYIIGRWTHGGDVSVIAVDQSWHQVAGWVSSNKSFAISDITRAVAKEMGDKEYELRWLDDPEKDADWRAARDLGKKREAEESP